MNMLGKVADTVMGTHFTTAVAGKPESDSETMFALVFRGKQNVQYEQVARPKIADPKDALIRITCSSLCGTDLHLYSGEKMGVKDGQVVGHECMGIIQEIGSEVNDFKVGDRVVVSSVLSCGTCNFCKQQQFSACKNTNPSNLAQSMLTTGATAGILGYGSLGGGYSGAQAEYVRVPFADVNLLKVPSDLPDEKALFLSDIACTSYHAALDLGKVQAGESVAIWGAGPVGIMAAKWCEIVGCHPIFVIEKVPERLELVQQRIPYVTTINFEKQDVLETITTVCPDGVDVSIDCTGFQYAKGKLHTVMRAVMLETDTPEIVNEAIQATKFFGRVVLIAEYQGLASGFNIGAMMMKHLTVAGGPTPMQAVWHKVLKRIQDGTFDPTVCLTTFGKLSEGPELYKQFFLKQNGVIKTFLRPDCMFAPGPTSPQAPEFTASHPLDPSPFANSSSDSAWLPSSASSTTQTVVSPQLSRNNSEAARSSDAAASSEPLTTTTGSLQDKVPTDRVIHGSSGVFM